MGLSKKQFAWWYYFWFLAALSAVLPFLGPLTLKDWALWSFELIGLVGLWAYLSRRPFAYRRFWRIYFVVAILAFLYSTAMLDFDLPNPLGHGNWHMLLIALLGLSFAVVLPLYVALWRYAFRSPDVWQAQPGAA